MMKRDSGVGSQKSVVAVSLGKSVFGLIFTVLVMGLVLTGCGGGGGGKKKDDKTNPPNYKAMGVGVIIQGQSNTGSLSVGSYGTFRKLDIYRKWIDLAPGGPQPRVQSTLVFRATAVSKEFLEDNTALILLAWDKVSGADHYHIYYGSAKVWESDKVDAGKDPGGFNPNNPMAYLDLDHELIGKISTAGEYRFQIVAVNAGDTEVTRLSEVSASLGMVLGQIPQNIKYNNPNLTWDNIANAHEYKMTIFNEDQYELSTFIYPVITRNASYDISSITDINHGHYNVWVDARYLDSLGNVKEIIRGIGGFDY